MFRRPRATPPLVACPSCGLEHPAAALGPRHYVCAGCGRYLSMPSPARIAMLADPGTFKEVDRNLISVDPLQFMDRRPYRDRLVEARRATGLREAATSGICRVGGRRIVLVVLDFGFLGGTMGSVVGEKVANAFEHATRRRIPLVSVAASGGARMQEGMLSLMQMAKVAAAAARHDSEGLAFLSILTDPTFGGVTASFASLGDVLIAEPGAQIGFVGPRVIEQTTGTPLPPDSHRAETVLRAGMIDLIVPRERLRETVAYLVGHLSRGGGSRGPAEAVPSGPAPVGLAAWEQVRLARHRGRPQTRDYIAAMTTRFVELHGDRQGGDDPTIVGGLAELDGETVVIVGHQRRHLPGQTEGEGQAMANPEGYRKALRLMRLGAKFQLPVVTLIDTRGANPSYESEQHGIAQTLALNLATMSHLRTPIVSVITGEGGSGGALALGVADRVLMLEHAIYSVIAPEGAAAILYRDAKKAEALSEALKLTARDLLRLGVIDAIVPEPEGGAHLDPAGAAAIVRQHLLAALRDLRRVPLPRLLSRRYAKYRHIGRVGVYWREIVRREMQEALDVLSRRLPWAEGPWWGTHGGRGSEP
ncbi:MAG TPA: acetyl-CoA carboxylase carboxyltransferase subunit alpha/beta [bacterium]|nr:acetyl-CoA carboxylase carboxyltransferase subunit alpha/beta [bacterium]